MLGGWGSVEAGKRGGNFSDNFSISKKNIIVQKISTSGKPGAPLVAGRLKKLDPDRRQMLQDEVEMDYNKSVAEAPEQLSMFSDDFIRGQLHRGSAAAVEDMKQMGVVVDINNLYNYSIIAFKSSRSLTTIQTGVDDDEDDIVDYSLFMDAQTAVAAPAAAAAPVAAPLDIAAAAAPVDCNEMDDSNIEITPPGRFIFPSIITFADAENADIASPGLCAMPAGYSLEETDEERDLMLILTANDIEDMSDDIELTAAATATAAAPFVATATAAAPYIRRPPSKWHIPWRGDNNEYYDVRTVIAMINRELAGQKLSKDRLMKIIQSCKKTETCHQLNSLRHSTASSFSASQCLGLGLYVAFLFDVKSDSDDSASSTTSKAFFVGIVIKMTTDRGVVWSDRVPLDQVPETLRIWCLWLVSVDGEIYQHGPPPENNACVLGKFAICQVRLTEIGRSTTSQIAVDTMHYAINKDDLAACNNYVQQSNVLNNNDPILPQREKRKKRANENNDGAAGVGDAMINVVENTAAEAWQPRRSSRF